MNLYYWMPLLATAAAGLLLIFTKRWHGGFSFDPDSGVQKQHNVPTSRIGGVAIAIGLLVACGMADEPEQSLLGPMLLAAIPAFCAGLLEDVTKQISVRWRLIATMTSGLLAWGLTDIAMQRTGLWGLDDLLQWTPAAVAFTAFVVSGVANATNIIDGFNGLASGVVAVMLTALGLIALRVDDTTLATVAFLCATTAVGFLFVNWPHGKIFMGDGGAYLLGFVVAWIAILLPMRHASLNGWATLLACAYPVIEVLFSIRRRMKRRGHHPGAPDTGHLHHLLNRRVVRKLFPSAGRSLQNGLTGSLVWFLAMLPAAWAVAFHDNTALLVLGFILASLGYSALYARLTQFVWCFQAATLRTSRLARSP